MRTVRFISLVSAMLLSGCVATSRNAIRSDSSDASHFTYTRIYCTADRETHFENVTVELSKMVFAPPAAPVHIGGTRPVSSAFFFGADPRWGAHDLENRLNHPTPAPQFATMLAGVFSLTTTDGETRQFRPGDVALLDDPSPCKGHIAVVGDKPAFVLFARE